MALGTTNINTTNVGSEIGSSSHLFSALVGASGLNKYSFYAPGSLSVDANKDVVLTPPASNYKLGEFRNYNHSSLTPSPQTNFTKNWGPSAGNFDFAVAWYPQAINIKCFAVPGDYVTMNFYPSATDRTNETNRIKQQITAITYNADTPLTGHSRQATYRANSTQAPVWIYGYPYGGLADPDTTIYMETFISDVAGNRKINLGVRANNYTTVTFHKNQPPYVYGTPNITPPPSGYTVAIPAVHSAATPICTTSQVAQTFNSTSYSFYVKIRGINGGQTRMLQATSATVTLTVQGQSQTVYTGALSYTSGQLCSGTLSNSKAWAYGDAGQVSITGVTWGANYTLC